MLVSLPKSNESVSLTWPNITALFGLRINSSTLLIDGISCCQRYREHHPAASASVFSCGKTPSLDLGGKQHVSGRL